MIHVVYMKNLSMPTSPHLSIIIPAMNEAHSLVFYLRLLQRYRHAGCEIIVVDGGSQDATPRVARQWADVVLNAPRGRAQQMNAGARVARGEVLLFLHADSQLPPHAERLIIQALHTHVWGRFNVRLSGSAKLLRVVETLMNLRSCVTGIATGDQGIFVPRHLFQRLGGFAEQPLMEDIEFSRRLRRYGRPACLRQRLITSSRRWEQQGILRTIWLMWRLRWLYFWGYAAKDLKRDYSDLR